MVGDLSRGIRGINSRDTLDRGLSLLSLVRNQVASTFVSNYLASQLLVDSLLASDFLEVNRTYSILCIIQIQMFGHFLGYTFERYQQILIIQSRLVLN